MVRPSAMAILRLKNDYLELNRSSIPYITATPLETNLAECHYVFEGPKKTPYSGGFYHGVIIFPSDYPFRPPAIYMFTPNGRFAVNKRLCFSMSDYHPEQWNPAWSVSTILSGLLSFMQETTPTYGSVNCTKLEIRRYAEQSLSFNLNNNQFRKLFPKIIQKIERTLKRSKWLSTNQIIFNEAYEDERNKILKKKSKFNEVIYQEGHDQKNVSSFNYISLIYTLCIFLIILFIIALRLYY